MAYEGNPSEAFPDSWRETIAQSSILLLQREVPRFINIEAAKVAKANNVTVIFDLGGRDDKITNETISLCDIISPNETELERLLSTLPQQDEPDKQSDKSAQESSSSEEVKSDSLRSLISMLFGYTT